MKNPTETIRALLAKANHPNTPEAEAETAAAMAAQLAAKHAVDLDALSDPREREGVVQTMRRVEGTYARQRLDLLCAIGDAVGCFTLYTTPRRAVYDVELWGTPTDGATALAIFDIIVGRMLAGVLSVSGRKARTEVVRVDGGYLVGGHPAVTTRRARLSWMEGYAGRIGRLLKEARQEVADSSEGAALVLVGATERAEQSAKEAGAKWRKGYTPTVDVHSQVAGAKQASKDGIGGAGVSATGARELNR